MLDCIVIGAGPGGLVTTKELLEQGVREVVCLEQKADVGGIFANTYDSLVLTTSCTYSMFSDFWIGDGKQHHFWTKNEAVDYWKRYATHFGIFDKIRFNSQVVAVIPQDNDRWQVQLASGETLVSKRVAVANGNNSYPKYPQWKDSLTDVDFCHSQEYRNSERFVGKNVLVVGAGESASEITLEISRVAKSCWVSIRNSTPFVVPRKRGGCANDIDVSRVLYKLPREYGYTLLKIVSRQWLSYKNPVDEIGVKLNEKIQSKYGLWGTYGAKTFALPTAIAHHGCKVVCDIIKVEDGGKTLIAADGETLQTVDAVVFATGYKNHVSFLPDDLKEIDLRSLYKQMFHPQYRDKIVWIGRARPSFGSQFPVMEMQARFFALICTKEKKLPASAEMKQVASMDGEKYSEQFKVKNASNFRSLVDYHFYMDDLADIIGCQPPLWQYFFLHPHLWQRMVYGATQGTQFRLRGPGQKKALAQELLAKLPVAPLFNPFFKYIFIAGFKARVVYGWKAFVKGLIPNRIEKKRVT
ncbi:MAG: NAD(P)-binding domain-containing protein [Symploca sp. SIO2E6]|nr:NAD(P)-binding domain-containing protein [Symploca sp. SIO2E6]